MTVRDVDPPRDQPVLTAIAVGAIALVLPVLLLAGDLRLATVPGVALAAALVAARRDTLHPLGALLVVAVLWQASHVDPLTPWCLVLAALMITAHSAVSLRNCLPPNAAVGPEIAARWVRRGAIVLAVTSLVYLVGVAVDRVQSGESQALVVLTFLLLGALVLLLRNQTVRTDAT